jgi:hypothetical protein
MNILDYPEIIKEPMDLSEVEKRLLKNKYQNRLDFAKDIKLIWKNAMTYNKPQELMYTNINEI